MTVFCSLDQRHGSTTVFTFETQVCAVTHDEDLDQLLHLFLENALKLASKSVQF